MKIKFIITMIVVFCNITIAQEIANNEFVTVDTISATELNQKRLFSATNAFLAKDYLSKRNKLKFSDKEEGIIICNGNWYYKSGKKAILYDLEFKISVGEIIIQLDDFYVWSHNAGYSSSKSLNSLLENNQNLNKDPRFQSKKITEAKVQIEKIRSYLLEGINERVESLK